MALGKEFFLKKIKNLCRVPAGLALGKATVNGAGAVMVTFLCRVSDKRHSAMRALPINFFVVCSLPSAALNKGFAECNLAFAECLSHSAKNLNPVVHGSFSLTLMGRQDIHPQLLSSAESDKMLFS